MTKKTEAKRQYKCGGCGVLGHNKRACPSKGDAAEPSAKVAVVVIPAQAQPAVEPAVEPAVVSPPPTATHVSASVAIDGNADLVGGHRTPNTRPAAPAAPFDCPTCHRVAILALCELADGAVALRCELCMNKSPLNKILKWGAMPEDRPKGQDPHSMGGRLWGQ